MNKIANDSCPAPVEPGEKKNLKDIERSIITTYRGHIWTKFTRAIKEYNLLKEGDKVLIAISGGKDSMIMAKLFQELKRHGQINFDMRFVCMDPGYHENIRELMVENCEYLGIPLEIYDSGIFDIVDMVAQDYPCYMCARMRRGALYNKAQELGCNKVALGHHFNDVIETTLLNVLYSGNYKTMLPRIKSANFPGIELIRPMYYIEEKHIINFTKASGIAPLNCACMVAAHKIGNKRYEIKNLIKTLKENFNDVDKSIFKSAQNVSVDSILGWQDGKEKHSFLERFDDEE
ncbi:tRNA(Ile)-lysidine synthase TilS/MesJ [Hathewaya proteolytica DSM 3090]|uniref:tRNA(Ile)-lysidine synthase TilS/MesJ n=1 Tax=Hathewaya proteolytica DSM 3090 TaxID=1121331 RepID=A0A1M6R9N3_9CLOT|nr:ATP-binding protein [Hathewaya proteolytica]SHK29017.1 tRNA(Ile)-lysidine synthase TilS/MesJ [Hathewaya proteolytica DSM 3090]